MDPSGVDAGAIGFRLAPRINAAGRLHRADAGLELLLTADVQRARAIAAELDAVNTERRDVETRILFEAEAQVAATPPGAAAYVLAADGWHPGVIGIVASRIAERHHRPAVLIALDGDKGTGSGRSIPAFDLLAGLEAASADLLRHGGHRAAAGLTIERGRVEAFRAAFVRHAAAVLRPEDLVPRQRVDAVVPGDALHIGLAEELERLAPFGMGNPEPCLLVPSALLADPRPLGEGRHVAFALAAGGARSRCVAFGRGGALPAAPATPVDAAVRLEINRYNGAVEPRLVLRHARPAAPAPITVVGEPPLRRRPARGARPAAGAGGPRRRGGARPAAGRPRCRGGSPAAGPRPAALTRSSAGRRSRRPRRRGGARPAARAGGPRRRGGPRDLRLPRRWHRGAAGRSGGRRRVGARGRGPRGAARAGAAGSGGWLRGDELGGARGRSGACGRPRARRRGRPAAVRGAAGAGRPPARRGLDAPRLGRAGARVRAPGARLGAGSAAASRGRLSRAGRRARARGRAARPRCCAGRRRRRGPGRSPAGCCGCSRSWALSWSSGRRWRSASCPARRAPSSSARPRSAPTSAGWPRGSPRWAPARPQPQPAAQTRLAVPEPARTRPERRSPDQRRHETFAYGGLVGRRSEPARGTFSGREVAVKAEYVEVLQPHRAAAPSDPPPYKPAVRKRGNRTVAGAGPRPPVDLIRPRTARRAMGGRPPLSYA